MMEDFTSAPSNDKESGSTSLKRKRSFTDQIEKGIDVVSSDDEFVSDGDSDLGFYTRDDADLSYLSATRTDNYSGLDITQEGPEGPWIRLLRLHPGQYDETLSGALIRRPLYENAVQYVALSYSWKQGLREDEEGRMPTSSLMLQYCAIDISEHLAHALRRLRKQRSPVYVWIDAICINQRDVDEKASQVPLMAQIYGNAEHVCVWLGEPPASSVTDSFLWICTQHRPWWSRLWVVQECIHSSQCPIILLGPQRMTLNQFVDKLSVMEMAHDNGRLEIVNSLRGLYEAWSKHELTNSAREPLLRRLLQTRHLKCEKPHDRAYALLSLVSERDAACIAVDYKKTPHVLAFQMVTALVGADEWAYGDFQLIGKSIMPIHSWSFRDPRMFYEPLRSLDRMAAYEQMTSHELDDMCLEPIGKSQLLSSSKLFDTSDPCHSCWLYRVFFHWWTMKLPAYDTQTTFQRLCYLYSRRPTMISDQHGIYEWTTCSGVCGFYFSPVQDMNAKVLFSMHENTALVIDDKNGTYPGYVLRGLMRDTPSKQHKILLDFASPSMWEYEPPTRMDGFNFSESLSVTPAKPAEDDLSARYRYCIGLKINNQGPDAREWKEHLATSARSLTPEHCHIAS